MTSLQAYTPYTYSPGFQSGQFHHVVLSISGTTHTLYLDGSAVNITTNNTNIFSSFTKIINPIFGAQPGLTQAFNGVIGDIRVYNYNISSTQVSNLYLDRNLVIHYPFDASVNNLTPNYATLVYDASFVGGATTTSNSLVGNGALSLTNTSGTTASQYVLSKPGKPNQSNWSLNSSTGLTISFWMNTAGPTAGNIMRLFDLPYSSSGFDGLSVDLSGTNMIYSRFSPQTIYTNSTYTISGDYLFIPFTESGALTLSQATTIYYLMVGGGGGSAYYLGGGGGGGGVAIGSIYVPSSDTLTINVGQGGTAATTLLESLPFTNNGGDGGNSSILFKTNKNLSVQVNGGKGPIVKTIYGSDGGKSGNGFIGGIGGISGVGQAGGGGGGGAGGAGMNATRANLIGGDGGDGYSVSGTIFNYILPTPTFFGGGGGGSTIGKGGKGGGGIFAVSGTPNTGGGGGGDSNSLNNVGYGGSGIVYIAIPYTSTPNSLNIPPVGTSSNLLAYYPFDTSLNSNSLNGNTPNIYSGTSVYDFSLNAGSTIDTTPGTYPTFFTGNKSLKISNNSSLHFVYVNNSSNRFTVSFWCYVINFNNLSGIISWNNTGNSNESIPENGSEYFLYHPNTSQLYISQNSSAQTTVNVNIFNPNVIPLKTWVFYSYSYDGNNTVNILVKPYSGGADIFNRSFTTNRILLAPKYFYFGQQSAYSPLLNGGGSISGYFKNFQFYSTNLTPTQLRNLYYTNNINTSSTLGPIDYLSYETQQAFINPTSVTNSVGGAVAYATILLYSGYTGPVMNIRNGTTNTSADFYADINGNLGTGYLASGLSLESWLTGAIPYVNVWYDQTGNKNHANQTSTSLQPVYNQISKYIDFGSGLTYGQSFGAGAYFNLPNGAVPYGNSNFTYTYKHGPKGTMTNNTVFNFGSDTGTSNAAAGKYVKSYLSLNVADIANNYFLDCFNDYPYTSPNSIIDNGVITTTYTAGMGFVYYINSTSSTFNQVAQTTTRTQDNTTNRIGIASDSINPNPLNRGLYYFYGVPKVLPDADRIIIESTTIYYGPTDYAIYYPLTNISENKVFNGVSKLYDATLNNNPTISTTNYKIAPGALSFNGNNQYVTGLPTFTPTSTSFSICIWFYFNELNNNYQQLFTINSPSTPANRISVFTNANNAPIRDNYIPGNLSFTLDDVDFGGYQNNALLGDQPIYPVVINQWTHLTWVVKDRNWYIYINGSLYATRTNITTPGIVSRSIIKIGSNSGTGDNMNGLVQDFRVYYRELNVDEITAIYNYPSRIRVQ